MADEVGAACGSAVVSARRVAGGDINDAWAMDVRDGRRLFVKTRDCAPAGEYEAEAAGLRWLGEAIACRRLLRRATGSWRWAGSTAVARRAGEERLGRELAAMHALGAPSWLCPSGGYGSARWCAPTMRASDVAGVLRRVPPVTGRAAVRADGGGRAGLRADRRVVRAAEPWRACTATCGVATSWPAPTASPG
jgi:hypothetical protein